MMMMMMHPLQHCLFLMYSCHSHPPCSPNMEVSPDLIANLVIMMHLRCK
jgi:hypothetical protein